LPFATPRQWVGPPIIVVPPVTKVGNGAGFGDSNTGCEAINQYASLRFGVIRWAGRVTQRGVEKY